MENLILPAITLLLLISPIIFLALLIFILLALKKSASKNKEQPAERKSVQSSADRKGYRGEQNIFRTINSCGIHKDNIFCNAYIPKNDVFSEIDIIAVTTNGIIVIESKNYSGWIFGTDSHKNWTQTLPRSNKNSFYNPVKQNQSHINTLANFLQLDTTYFINIVVFGDNCELKSIKMEKYDACVIKNEKLPRVLGEIRSSANTLTDEQVAEVCGKIKNCCNVTEQVKQQHLDYVNTQKHI